MYTDEQCKAFWTFDQTPSVRELTTQLNNGLIQTTEYAKAILGYWNDFIALPQNTHLNLPKM